MLRITDKPVKCSNNKCKEVFHISESHEVGGINDRGYIEVRCKKCGSLTTIRMENPRDDGFYPNFEIVKAWEDDDYHECNAPLGESAFVVGREPAEGIPIVFDPDSNFPFWQDDENNLEEIANDSFGLIESNIREQLRGIYNCWVKSIPGYSDIERCVISQEYENGGKLYTATWGKILQNDDDFISTSHFHLIDHSDSNKEIDGIFSRNEMMAYLLRCLMRWRLIANEVIVVTPFIGFDFSFSGQKHSEELINLWKLLNSILDMEKTTFITRVSTYRSLKKRQEELEVPADVLKEWDLMNNLQKMFDNPKTRVKQKEQFHAKLYAGVFDDHVELLSGSFNFQTGKVLEQMHLRHISRERFKLNYLDRLVNGFEYKASYNPKTFYISIDKDNVVKSKVTDLKSFASQK